MSRLVIRRLSFGAAIALAIAAAIIGFPGLSAASSAANSAPHGQKPIVSHSIKNDVSPALRSKIGRASCRERV